MFCGVNDMGYGDIMSWNVTCYMNVEFIPYREVGYFGKYNYCESFDTVN